MDNDGSPEEGQEQSRVAEMLSLLEFATPSQKRILNALIEHGSHRATAEVLGMSRGTISDALLRVRKAAAARGHAPEHDMTHVVPEPFLVKGVSTYFNGNGDVGGQWVKSAVDQQQLVAMAKSAATAFFAEQTPLPPAGMPDDYMDSDLLTVYVMADLHLGMYSWARETGDDYNCDIAANLASEGFRRLMERTPPSEYCVIAQLGDLLHLDDDSNQTKRGKNPLDVDTRYQRVAEVGCKVYRRVIDMALRSHDTVHIVNVPGNHDDISGYWLGVAVKTAYENDPRVTIDDSPGPFFYHKFGRNLLGFCHGHTAKPEALGEIMVADVPQWVGETYHRHWLTGHIHHNSLKEGRIATVESFRTLAARDSWHNSKGYRSGRDIKAIVYHKEWGESDRFITGVREILEG